MAIKIEILETKTEPDSSTKTISDIEKLDNSINDRIYKETVKIFYEKFKSLGLLEAEVHFLSLLSPQAQKALILTLETHVHKEKSVFAFLIAKKFKLDEQQTQAIAITLDILWMLSLMFDDLQDGDVNRAGKPTVWTIFGKDKTYEIGFEILNACVTNIGQVCGDEVAAVVQESVYRGVQANLSHENFAIEQTSPDELYASYDNRNEFSGVLGIDLIYLLSETELLTEEQKEQLKLGIKLLNRASQVLNDLKDIDDSYQRGFSDIKNGFVTVPILLLFSNLGESEKSHFLTFFGQKRELTKEEKEFLLAQISQTRILAQAVMLIKELYTHAEVLLANGFEDEDKSFLRDWIKYKSEPLERYAST